MIIKEFIVILIIGGVIGTLIGIYLGWIFTDSRRAMQKGAEKRIMEQDAVFILGGKEFDLKKQITKNLDYEIEKKVRDIKSLEVPEIKPKIQKLKPKVKKKKTKK